MNKRESYKKNSPEGAMCEFLYAWKERRWVDMIAGTHPTWRKSSLNPNPLEELDFLLGHFELECAVIQNVNRAVRTGISYWVRTKLFLIHSEGKKITKAVSWLVHYETEDFKLDTSLVAKWGVNPLSGAKELNKNNPAFLERAEIRRKQIAEAGEEIKKARALLLDVNEKEEIDNDT